LDKGGGPDYKYFVRSRRRHTLSSAGRPTPARELVLTDHPVVQQHVQQVELRERA